MRRLGVVVTTCTLLVSACGSDRNDAVSTTVAPITTVAAPDSTGVPTSETVGSTPITSPDTSEPAAADETTCAYRQRLLVSQEDLLADDLVDPSLVTPITQYNDLMDVGAGNLTDEDFVHIVGQAGDPILFIYDVGANDPLQVATQVVAAGGHASPVLATEIAFHWTFAPGTDYNDSGPVPDAPAAFNPDNPPRVAVVDTGYTDTPGTPQWLKERVSLADANRDVEQTTNPEYEGHGKFVASLIAQQAPEVQIVEAAMPKVDVSDFLIETDDLVNSPSPTDPFITDELGLFAAIGRLTHAGSFNVLNLSLGTWTCSGLVTSGGNSSGLLMEAALNWWRDVNPDSFVVAAAGNHPVGVTVPADTEFIPAAWSAPNQEHHRDGLISVAALDKAGSATAQFSNEGDVHVIGDGLLGVRVDDHGTYWGGSSFATAIVSAWVAVNNQLPTSPTIDLAPSLQQTLKP